MSLRKAQSAMQTKAKPLGLEQKREEGILYCFIWLRSSLKMLSFPLTKNMSDDELFCKSGSGAIAGNSFGVFALKFPDSLRIPGNFSQE